MSRGGEESPLSSSGCFCKSLSLMSPGVMRCCRNMHLDTQIIWGRFSLETSAPTPRA